MDFCALVAQIRRCFHFVFARACSMLFGAQCKTRYTWLRTNAPKRAGYSLLEVVLASSICASALVPALAVMRDGMTLGDIVDTKHLLLIYGVSKMEEQLAIIGATWATGTVSGNFASDGQSSIRFNATCSDSAVDGGITNQLMAITVTTYNDDNANSTMDSSEPRLTFSTKIAKSVSYATRAGS